MRLLSFLAAASCLFAPLALAAGEVSSSNFHKQDKCGGQVPLDTGKAYHMTTGKGRLGCAKLCAQDERCLSYTTSGPDCLLYPVRLQTCGSSVSHPRASYYVKRWCYNGGTLVVNNCTCPNHTWGDRCQLIMRDCRDWIQWTNMSGVYWVQPTAAPHPFQVYCQMEFGGRTYIQSRHRDAPAVSFNRTWEAYKTGFGDLSGQNFWLGLQQVYWLTASREKVLILEQQGHDQHGKYVFSQRAYGYFRMGDESQEFEMLQYWGGTWGSLYDCFTVVIGSKFVTSDHGQNASLRACAATHGSGWWVKSGGSTCDILCNANGRIKAAGAAYQSGDAYFKDLDSTWNIFRILIFLE